MHPHTAPMSILLPFVLLTSIIFFPYLFRILPNDLAIIAVQLVIFPTVVVEILPSFLRELTPILVKLLNSCHLSLKIRKSKIFLLGISVAPKKGMLNFALI